MHNSQWSSLHDGAFKFQNGRSSQHLRSPQDSHLLIIYVDKAKCVVTMCDAEDRILLATFTESLQVLWPSKVWRCWCNACSNSKRQSFLTQAQCPTCKWAFLQPMEPLPSQVCSRSAYWIVLFLWVFFDYSKDFLWFGTNVRLVI